jgi:replicative DNA helicase
MALLLDRAEQRVFELRDDARTARLRHIRLALDSAYDKLGIRVDRPFEVPGLGTGFREIDSKTEGFNPGDFVVVAARPSVGKTSFALSMVYNAARADTACLVFSLEMDTKQIVSRFLGLTGEIADLLLLRAGNSLAAANPASGLMRLPILIDDTPGISIMELRTKTRRAMAQSKGKLGLIVVDYLQLMRTGEHEENRVQEVATITRNLKSLARELNVVVVALSQLSRAAGDAGAEPKLTTLRESGAIEQDADVVIMLWRDREEPEPGAPRLIHGSLAKNRNGPTGQFDLYFLSSQARFFSADRGSEGIPV